MKKKLKITSFILSLILIIVCVPTSTISGINDIEDENDNELSNQDQISTDPISDSEIIESETLDQLKYLPDDAKPISELKEMSVDTDSLPEFINATAALEKGHVNRLYSSEGNLSTVVYQNNDGTESIYLFSRPVKYIDETGKVSDKSSAITSIENITYSYASLNNSIKTYFPKSILSGLKLQYKGYSITMSPKSSSVSAPILVENNTIVYNNAFGRNTMISYKTKLNGVKEDIILIKYTNQNEFEFDLILTSLTPIQTENAWYLRDTNNEIVASFGKVLIKDSAGKTIEGTMSIEETNTSGKYSLRISVPGDFLKSSDTQYPVYIDPTITIYEYETFYEDGYIIRDTGLYSNSAAALAAESSYDYHKLGYDSSTGATGKVIYKLYDFFGTNGRYRDIFADEIGSAYIYLGFPDGSAFNLTASPMTNTWSTSAASDPIALYDTALWNAYSTINSSTTYISATASTKSINITDILKGWADYNQGFSSLSHNNPANGFVISNSSSNTYREVESIDSFDAEDVYVVIDTSQRVGVHYVCSAYSDLLLGRDSSDALISSTYNTTSNVIWYLEYLGDDIFHIRTSNNSSKILQTIGSNVLLAEDGGSESCLWIIESAVGGGLIIKNSDTGFALKHTGQTITTDSLPSSTSSTYKQCVWSICQRSNYVNLNSFKINTNWVGVGSSKSMSVTPTPSNATWSAMGWYTLSSADTSIATVSKVNGQWRVNGIKKGTTYINATHKITGNTQKIYISVGQLVNDGAYYFMNKSSTLYLDLEGPSSGDGANIQISDIHNGSHGQWQIAFDQNTGYYTIKSLYSNKYIGVNNSSPIENQSITQFSSSTDATKWSIFKMPSGAYMLMSKLDDTNGKCLSVPLGTVSSGTDCKLRQYGEDSNYQDEWYLSRTDRRIAIRVVYDNGYEARYENPVNNRITANINKVREKCAELFELCIVYTDISVFPSFADSLECANKSNYNKLCFCGGSYACTSAEWHQANGSDPAYWEYESYHHKNVKNIVSRAMDWRVNCDVLLIFTGHETCDSDDWNGCYARTYMLEPSDVPQGPNINGELGFTTVNRDAILISNFISDLSETKTLFHETGHLFGAPDHYGTDCRTTCQMNASIDGQSRPKYSNNCIYGENKEDYDVAHNLIICPGCMYDIIQFIE